MSASLTALCYLVAGRPVHPGAARPVQSRHVAPGQPLRHDRHGGGGGGDAAASRHGRRRLCADPAGHRHRRRDRRGGGAAHPDDALPQLVAAFHSLVGLAAVFVAAGALNAPEAFGIGVPGNIHTQSLVEMSIGLAIGAVTFSGSLIAFAKLQRS